MLNWSITEHASQDELDTLSRGVTEYGRSLAVGGNACPVACLVKDGERLIAGASGRTEFHRLFVGFLWVTEERRLQGLGTQVLSELEAFALSRGCRDSLLETLSDRTASLYSRLGYAPVATIPNYVGAFTKHIMLKKFGTSRGAYA